MWLYGVLSILYTFYQNMVEATRPFTDAITFYQNMVEATRPFTDAISSWQPKENRSIKVKYNSRFAKRNSHKLQGGHTTVHVVDITI
jgi:hypothetical protein